MHCKAGQGPRWAVAPPKNYKATCFDYRLVILRPILSNVSQDAMHTLGSHRVVLRVIEAGEV